MLRNVCWYWWLYGCHTTDAAPAPSDEQAPPSPLVQGECQVRRETSPPTGISLQRNLSTGTVTISAFVEV